MTKLKLGLIVLVVGGGAIALVMQHRTEAKLREEIHSLRQQIAQLQADNENLSSRFARTKVTRAPRLPAPPMPVTAQTNASPTEDLPSTNLLARFQDKEPRLTIEQVEAYLKANGRNAASLLAAYRTAGDSALLAEAMQRYPDDPQVAFEAVFKKDGTPEQRRQWLEAFERSAPDNALANYLSALDYFKTGQSDQAVQELIAASGKQQFQDYSLSRDQDDEEAFLAAGYSPAEAKALAAWQLLLPQLAEMKQLSQSMVDLSKSYQQSGDQASAQATLQMAAAMGERYGSSSPGEAMVSQLVGIAMERIALGAMDPNSPYGNAGQTVQDQLNELARQNSLLRGYAQQTTALLPMLSDQDWMNYKDRWKTFGEEAAEQWLINKWGRR